MPYYRRVGEVPAKRHVRVPSGDGGWLAEELMGTAGFAGGSSLLYHRHSPSAIEGAEVVADDRPVCAPDQPLLPRHLRTTDLEVGGDPVRDRHVLLANADVTISIVHADRSSGLFRNAVGDELAFVQEGSAIVETAVRAARRSVPAATSLSRCRPSIGGSSPRRASTCSCSRRPVMSLRRAATSPTRVSSAKARRSASATCTRRRSSRHPNRDRSRCSSAIGGGLTSYCQSHHPFDVVGWDGTVYPYRFSIHDFEPIVGAVHQPPPVHQTFEGPGFVVCSFVPRPFDFGPDATKVPYHHANVDCDEVLFYAGGDFMSRAGSGIGVGSISFHPAGFVHGPQPGSVDAAADQERTEELAVMVDTFRPLDVSDLAREISAPEYPWTWTRRD